MTNEEAITYANCLKNNYTINFDDMTDFCDVAIKALEQEPCEDAISRKAVLDLIVANHTELNGVNVVMYSPLYKDIKQLPSVRPKEKVGHWIDKFGGVYRCSCCREIISIDTEIEHPNGITYKYCPNCGCRIERSE